MGLQVALVGCLHQLLLHNKYKYHSGIQQEVFLTLCLRVSGGGFASDCRSSGHLGQLCITPVFWGPCHAVHDQLCDQCMISHVTSTW